MDRGKVGCALGACAAHSPKQPAGARLRWFRTPRPLPLPLLLAVSTWLQGCPSLCSSLATVQGSGAGGVAARRGCPGGAG